MHSINTKSNLKGALILFCSIMSNLNLVTMKTSKSLKKELKVLNVHEMLKVRGGTDPVKITVPK